MMWCIKLENTFKELTEKNVIFSTTMIDDYDGPAFDMEAYNPSKKHLIDFFRYSIEDDEGNNNFTGALFMLFGGLGKLYNMEKF
jgi:hypothetical protein